VPHTEDAVGVQAVGDTIQVGIEKPLIHQTISVIVVAIAHFFAWDLVICLGIAAIVVKLLHPPVGTTTHA